MRVDEKKILPTTSCSNQEWIYMLGVLPQLALARGLQGGTISHDKAIKLTETKMC